MNSANMVLAWQSSNLSYKSNVNIQYRHNTCTTQEILMHLKKCDVQFVPELSLTVDLPAYAAKIYEKADRFEAWQNNELVGLIAAYFNDTTNAVGFITNVSVDNAYSGFGIASTLLANCIDHGKTLHFKWINLEVNKNNSKAINLYKKFRFAESGIVNNNLVLKHTIAK